MTPEFQCSCKGCVASCRYKPGLFMPEEVEPLAEAMGLSFEQLVKTRLALEWADTEGGDRIFALSPATVGIEPGREFPPNRRYGRCTFLKDDRCEIHALGKPYQCAMATHKGGADLDAILRAWLPYQHCFVGPMLDSGAGPAARAGAEGHADHDRRTGAVDCGDAGPDRLSERAADANLPASG